MRFPASAALMRWSCAMLRTGPVSESKVITGAIASGASRVAIRIRFA